MKPLLGLVFVFLFSNLVFSQKRFEIVEKKSTNLRPYYSKNFKQYLDTIHLPLRLTGRFDSVHVDSNVMILQVKKYNLPNNPVLQTNNIIFPKEVWPAGRNKVMLDTVITLNIITQTIGDSLKNDEIGHIVIAGQALDQYHTIRLSNTALLHDRKYKGKPFWVEVGTNFDLIDGPVLAPR